MPEDTLKILCPYCNSVYTAKMIDDLEAEGTYDTFGADGGAEMSGTIDIYCDNCKKLVYRKEF